MSTDELDPIRMWREWFVKSEKMWSDALTEMMGDEKFSQGMGRYVREGLHAHRMFSESMAQYLANLNIPSRTDILDMTDRVHHIEDALSQIQVELREQRGLLAKFAAGGSEPETRKRPARTKKRGDEVA